MKRKIVDLSVSLKDGIKSDPPSFLPHIRRVSNAEGAEQLAATFPGLKASELPNQQGWAVEFVELSTHSGTHIDAPLHYHSHQDDGTPAMSIDQIPLEWCFGPGVKLDFRSFPNGHIVTASEIDAELKRIGHRLSAGDIVLANTSAGARYGHDDFLDSGCGFGREATLHLTRQGVRMVGTDAWSWDVPFKYTAERFAKTRNVSLIWEGHYAGSTIPYCQIEKLGNLDQLPPTGFDVIALPAKIEAASAGWARPVAIIR